MGEERANTPGKDSAESKTNGRMAKWQNNGQQNGKPTDGRMAKWQKNRAAERLKNGRQYAKKNPDGRTARMAEWQNGSMVKQRTAERQNGTTTRMMGLMGLMRLMGLMGLMGLIGLMRLHGEAGAKSQRADG
jgi:hypothetical protein